MLSYNMKMRLVPTSLYQGVEHFGTEWYGKITQSTRETTRARLYSRP